MNYREAKSRANKRSTGVVSGSFVQAVETRLIRRDYPKTSAIVSFGDGSSYVFLIGRARKEIYLIELGG